MRFGFYQFSEGNLFSGKNGSPLEGWNGDGIGKKSGEKMELIPLI